MLVRFWLRVDGVLVRLYETRYMADFRASSEQPQLTREVRCCEGTFDALHAAGAPPDGVSFFLLSACSAGTTHCTIFGVGLPGPPHQHFLPQLLKRPESLVEPSKHSV